MGTILIAFVAQVVVISLSGVMAPGPITAATLAAGTRSRHAGSLIAVGHGLIEFPLILLVIAGAGTLLASRAVTVGIGLVGGGVLVVMGAGMLRNLGKPAGTAGKRVGRGPVLTGVILTGTNPYFLLWWLTVGLNLTTRALQIGALALGLLAAVHWLCDLVWLEALSFTSFKGTKLLGAGVQKIVLGVCSVALIGLGLFFAVDAVNHLRGRAGDGDSAAARYTGRTFLQRATSPARPAGGGVSCFGGARGPLGMGPLEHRRDAGGGCSRRRELCSRAIGQLVGGSVAFPPTGPANGFALLDLRL
jgi:threonine/homoserine/homoserine lactone efflux protein